MKLFILRMILKKALIPINGVCLTKYFWYLCKNAVQSKVCKGVIIRNSL